MQLHNTLTGKKESFVPAGPDRVTMYVCGPTVYAHAHIGNYRPPVVFDVLARVLRRRFGDVTYVRNITDIDDKINAAAQAEGADIGEIATRYTAAYYEELAALGVAETDAAPRVTAHLPDILAMISRLVDAGHAYVAEGHVLFDVGSYPGYGELSRRDRRELIAGARVDVAPYKRDPGDFVLWKPSSPELPGWDSLWGRGRPGWHIECSAMAAALLGETIDIHGGGTDLVFPHHENERAQSVCAHGGKPFARFWVHNGLVTLDREKMAKSVGNVLLLRDLLADHPGEAIRLALLGAHYRQPLDWTDDTPVQARRQLDRLYGALRALDGVEPAGDAPPAPLVEALEDDLNTPRALAALFELAHEANTAGDTERPRIKAELLAGAALLGLLRQPAQAWFRGGTQHEAADPAEIDRLVAAREAAREARDFTEADRIRDDLAARGIQIEDTPQGARWRTG